MSNPNFNPTLSTDEIWRGTNSNRCLSDDLDVLGVEDTTYPGCYHRTVNGVTEWINPPMVVGNEYRTTKRWNGKAVYAKLVDCGLSVDGTKKIEGVISGTRCVRVEASLGGWALPAEVAFENQTHQYFGYVTSDAKTIYVHCSNGWKGVQVYATIYYTKD